MEDRLCSDPVFTREYELLSQLRESTHTLAGCYAGAVVNEKRGKNRSKHLDSLLRLVSTPQLDTQQGEEGGGGRLLLPAAWM